MDVDDAAGFAEVDLEGSATIDVDDVLSDDGVHLSVETTCNGRIGVAVKLNADEARELAEELLAHAVLLDE